MAALMLGLSDVHITALIVAATTRAATGRLPHNQWIGIRTPAAMRSEPAWIAGHRAARRLAPLYVLAAAATSTALFVALLWASPTRTVLLIGIVGFTASTLVGVSSICAAAWAAKGAIRVGR
jgi:hypothetical protein